MNNGVAPFNMPVTDDDTRSSANGKIESGSAIQIKPSIHTRRISARSIFMRRADGNRLSVANPKPRRIGVIVAAGNASSPSAMK